MPESSPIYDNAMKALSAHVPVPLLRWIGVDIEGEVSPVRLRETAPERTARQVDALIAVGDSLVVHLEFESHSQPAYALDMLDHRIALRGRPELDGKRLVQHVVMLGPGRIDDGILDGQVTYRYRVHYLRNLPVEPLLADPALAPLAALADVADDDRPAVLRRALELIAAVRDDRLRTALAAAAIDLAGLRLGADVIDDLAGP